MNTNLEQQTTFARRMAVAIMCLLAVGVLALAVSIDDNGGLVREAAAAETDAGPGYFPAQFPTPGGPVESHIEQF
jgi:hypothetical protein